VDPVSTPDPVRIGNSEREAAVRQLGEHFAEGRLEPEEYEERTSAAYAARTTEDLVPLFKDLPRTGEQPTVAVPPHVPYPTAAYPATTTSRDLEAPYGREPATGIPYSERYKVIAGVLQILVPFGVGRFYTGHIGMGVAQLLVSLTAIGVLWSIIDGILILVGRSVDGEGRPLRP
jgi:TM2 domain-containing membrane protein YozV